MRRSLGLEAVEWTREWIREIKDLRKENTSASGLVPAAALAWESHLPDRVLSL